eukprot:m.235346 g.235346  ORF g.235346 m.235346 type:complete len:149 (+) comp33664_c1_seq53:1989-2435(+)
MCIRPPRIVADWLLKDGQRSLSIGKTAVFQSSQALKSVSATSFWSSNNIERSLNPNKKYQLQEKDRYLYTGANHLDDVNIKTNTNWSKRWVFESRENRLFCKQIKKSKSHKPPRHKSPSNKKNRVVRDARSRKITDVEATRDESPCWF